MIILLSQGSYEFSTEGILQWLDFYKAKAIRLNGEDLLRNENHFLAVIDDKKWYSNNIFDFDTDEVKVVFFRRYGTFENVINLGFINKTKVRRKLSNHLLKEYGKLYDHLLNYFPNAKTVSSFADERKLNKLSVLYWAKKRGLNIPSTIVTNRKNDIINFLKVYKECTVKPINQCEYFIGEDNVHYKMLSIKISHGDLGKIPTVFFPTCVQKYIKKEFEIRTFFIEDVCYSMAIFSQNNNKTMVDFRDYDNENPNRTVPYKLPTAIEKKLKDLMNGFNLETGSIDLIKSTDGKYYFLEINPNGQFGMVSYPCNYFLERVIAKYLISLSNGKE